MTRVFKLSGGLGNQLFQYFSAARCSMEDESELILDASNVHFGKINHNSWISSIELPLRYSLINHRITKLSVLIGKFRKSIGYKLRRFNQQGGTLVKPEYLETQNSINFEFISSKFPQWSATLVNESIWVRQMFSLANRTDFIAVHIRRGDYLLSRNIQTIGLLDLQYFVEAIDYVRKQHEELPIWVFTDDPMGLSEKMMKFPENSRLISPPKGTDPAEVLILMSKAKAMVLSNSTFSWWGARFSKSDTVKVVPCPWYKSLPVSDNFLPESWHKFESVWVDEFI